MTKFKHLTPSNRNDIQAGLQAQLTFRQIAENVGKDPSTISKEVRRYSQIKESTLGAENGDTCPKLKKAPYTCNGCPFKSTKCKYVKKFYYAKRAQRKYEENLSESRQGIPLNKQEFYEMDKLVSKKLKQGQHLNHIIESNDLGASRASIYRYIHQGYMGVKPIDLPRVVKFKKRKTRELPPIPSKDKKGRSYQDFLTVLANEKLTYWLEMDTVIGRIGGKTLLTFNVSFCNFIFACLLDNKTAHQVAIHIQKLKKTLYENGLDFSQVFPIILTDNGGEFARIDDIELDHLDQSRLFFCEPNRSDQKGRIEKNHTLIRDILPKGTSFDDLTQEDINLVLSHVNSVKRQNLNGKSAYEMFTFTFGHQLAHLLGITEIPANKVCQSPQLLKDKNNKK